MVQLLHLVPAYSNAVLLAVLPHVTDFAARLDLPAPRPIGVEQVSWLRAARFSESQEIRGALQLTNGFWFGFDHHGAVVSFQAPDYPYGFDDRYDITKFYGQDRITTNQAIAMAREALRRLGYTPEQTRSSGPPTEWEGSWDATNGWFQAGFRPGHFPYCRARWVWPPPEPNPGANLNTVEVAINMDRKSVAGIILIFSRTNSFLPTSVLRLPATAEEIDRKFKAQAGGGARMFFRSNAPPRFPGADTPPAAPARPEAPGGRGADAPADPAVR